MKKHHPIGIIIGLALIATAHAEDPQELISARAAYQQSIDRAIDPLKARYQTQLERLRDSFTRAGKLAEALSVDTEIKSLSAQKADKPAEISADSKTAAVISARSETGVALGAVKKGQRIRLQYIDGLWTSTGGKPVSPDNAPHGFVKVAVVGLAGGKEEVAMIVPNGTKSRPFSESFKKDYDEVWLRINDHTKIDNAGEVIYKASIK